MRRAGKFLGLGLAGFAGAALFGELRAQTRAALGSSGSARGADESRATASYVWGNGVRTEKSEYLNSYPQYEPVKLETFDGRQQPCLQQLFFGPGVEGGVDAKGDLFVWPMLKQLSLEPEVLELTKQRSRVARVASGVLKAGFVNDACICLQTDGSVLRLPMAWDADADGEVQGYQLDPKGFARLEGVSAVADLSFGEEHVLALGKDGLVYCYGDDTLGQCGQGPQGRKTSGPFAERRSDRFEQVPGLENVKAIAAGSHHSLAIDGEARLFGWGNNSFFQISHSDQYLRFRDPLMVSFAPLQIVKGLTDKKALRAAAGRDFSVVVAEDGQGQTVVFGSGVNKFGQLGVGEFSDCEDMAELSSLSRLQFQPEPAAPATPVKVDQLACGFDHCLCLTNMKVLFEWGANAHGQLGNKRKNNSSHPLILATFNDKHVLHLACGQNSSSVITAEDL